ncbi:hypothetical protein ACFXCZ_33740 [Streptomyces sp. NPDC059396]|uniref:hypothetical protein n=1 Tax=Streptomyces sp. NPDC059396 TaxID=3346819 RepID=UPI0036D094E1
MVRGGAGKTGDTWQERFVLAHLVGGAFSLGWYAFTDTLFKDAWKPGQRVAMGLFLGWSLLVWLKRRRRRAVA